MDSGDQGLFWGVILKPEKRYEQIVEEDFRITKACVDPSTLDSGKVASVILEKDNDEFIICNLTSPTGLSEPMDLAFAVGEKVVFRTEGGATVHLTGHTQPQEEMNGYPDFIGSDDGEEAEEEESSDDDGEEEEEEEESPPKLVKKRKLEQIVNGTGSSEEKSAKKQKKEAVKQAEAMKEILAKEKVEDQESSDEDDADDQMEEDMDKLEKDVDDSDGEGEEEEEDSEETAESSPEPVKKEATPKAKKEKKKKQEKQETPAKNGIEKEAPKKEDVKETEKVKEDEEQEKEPQTPAKTDAEPAETPKSKKKKNKNKFKEAGENGQEQQAKTPGKDKAKTPGKDQAKTPGKDQAKTPGKEDAGKTPKKTLKGGIQVEDIRVGNGPEAKAGKMVGMYYDGKLTKSGKRFDACKQGKPFKFKLGRGEVIKGWDVGVEGMKVGGKRRLIIPAPLGYGSQGAPPDIPPNASLTFEVECKMVN